MTTSLAVRRVFAGDAEYHRTLHVALDLLDPPSNAPFVENAVRKFLDTASRRSLITDVLTAVCNNDVVRFACLLVESPGRAAMIAAPWNRIATDYGEPICEALSSTLNEATVRGAAFVEALVAEPGAVTATCLNRSGFRRLTQLIYLQRRASIPPLHDKRATSLDWINYTPERQALFVEALERSYVDSLDCPELCGLRPTPEVLMGHRASGDFDPTRWFVACRNGAPVAVLLLSALPEGATIEIVYMGVAQVARGSGVSDAVLRRAVDATIDSGATSLTLAVDSRNIPARGLYARWGFVEIARRDAWIATPDEA